MESGCFPYGIRKSLQTSRRRKRRTLIGRPCLLIQALAHTKLLHKASFHFFPSKDLTLQSKTHNNKRIAKGHYFIRFPFLHYNAIRLHLNKKLCRLLLYIYKEHHHSHLPKYTKHCQRKVRHRIQPYHRTAKATSQLTASELQKRFFLLPCQ